MRRICFQIVILSLMTLFIVGYASAHCEIPCGIYDDQMRVNMIGEHITTIEKSKQLMLCRH